MNPQLNMRRLQGQGGRFGDPLLSSGTTPLLRSLVAGNMEVARMLLEKGANPNIYGMGISPFLYASGITGQNFGTRGGIGAANTEIVELMIKHGADVNAQIDGANDYSGRIARALTGDLTATSNEGMTALHAAAQNGNPTFVRYLLDHGARTDIKDASGRTPLDVLNGVKALQPAVFAEASGLLKPGSVTATVAPPPSNAPRGGGRGGPSPAAVQEIRTMLQEAAQKK